jgi:hypothetical protein
MSIHLGRRTTLAIDDVDLTKTSNIEVPAENEGRSVVVIRDMQGALIDDLLLDEAMVRSGDTNRATIVETHRHGAHPLLSMDDVDVRLTRAARASDGAISGLRTGMTINEVRAWLGYAPLGREGEALAGADHIIVGLGLARGGPPVSASGLEVLMPSPGSLEHRQARRDLQTRRWASFAAQTKRGGDTGVSATCPYCGAPCWGADARAADDALVGGVVHMVCDGQALTDAAEEDARRAARDRRDEARAQAVANATGVAVVVEEMLFRARALGVMAGGLMQHRSWRNRRRVNTATR